MATVNDTDFTLFSRLAQLRAKVQQASTDLDQIFVAMREPAKTEGWNADDDLAKQLAEAASALEVAADYLMPEPNHVDQVLPRMILEVPHG